jgi:hypothetical protein
MKSALVICFSDLKRDARVTRQIGFLKEEFKVTAACFDAYEDGTFEFCRLEKTPLTFIRKVVSSFFLLSGLNKTAYRILYNYHKYAVSLKERKFDLIVANDFETLPLAFNIKSPGTKIFLDAHEYAPRQFEDRLYWRIFFQRFTTSLCKKYIPLVDGMSTINNGIARAYEKQFAVKPVIVTNATAYVSSTPETRTAYPIRLVHHGIFNVSRQPHIMIDLMRLLDDRFTLDLIYLLPEGSSQKTKEYYEAFKKSAAETGRIQIKPALKSSEIVPYIHAHYDMGIILVPPVNFNYENGLPNKLFDCIQARLAMAVGPLHEIAEITNRFGIGVVSEDFTAEGMAAVLQKVDLVTLDGFKKNTETAARAMNADFNKTVFLEAVRKTLNQ